MAETNKIKEIKEPLESEAQEPKTNKEDSSETPKNAAKAGKRSAKAQKETEEKKAKEGRKQETGAKSKPKSAKPPRSKLQRAGKKYRKAAELVQKDKLYNLREALELALKTSPAKFTATVEMHINLDVDPKQADQNVRGTLSLPAGTGKAVRIAVLADEDDAKKATQAGADLTGSDDLLAKLEKEELDFDILIATPPLMPKLGKYARLLGPRGLMPNPKSGTVATDVSKAVTEAKGGKVEYRVDQAGILHLAIGKVNFKLDDLEANAQAVVGSVRGARPASLKGAYIKSAYITTSMGPSIKTDIGG